MKQQSVSVSAQQWPLHYLHLHEEDLASWSTTVYITDGGLLTDAQHPLESSASHTGVGQRTLLQNLELCGLSY